MWRTAGKVRDALPEELKALWQIDNADRESVEERAAAGRAAQNAEHAHALRARAANITLTVEGEMHRPP